MAALFPSIASNTVHSQFDRASYSFVKPTDIFSLVSTKQARSFKDFRSQQRFSPQSPKSTVSIPVARNDENVTPLSKQSYWPLDAISAFSGHRNRGKTERKSTTNDHVMEMIVPKNRQPGDGATLSSQTRSRALLQLSDFPKYRFHNDTPTRAKQNGYMALSNGYDSDSTSQHVIRANAGELGEFSEPFPLLVDYGREEITDHSDHLLPFQTTPSASAGNRDTGSVIRCMKSGHRQRPSNASSAFVHTIKTASISDTSLSILARSLRIGRSSESSGCVQGHTRHSLDSDRPIIDSSSDEAALRRGLRRKQILDELVLTEEGYVADLKALVYLYSTLLASTTTIPSQIRTTVQHNMSELLHNHELLLGKLQQAMYNLAARKWADTRIPARLELGHRIRFKGIGTRAIGTPEKRHYRFRSSIDTAEVAKNNTILGAADPSDVLEIAEIFESLIATFFAYEEYCANHGTIAGELQQQLPNLWSTYESGMEALSRSITSLNRRRHHGRKGLTVSDLLIKPVQRICRYPLLLEDLLMQTPIIDGPAAHKAVEKVLNQFRNIAQTVNFATDNHATRSQIQRKWLLRDRLILHDATISQDQFRSFGNVQLCGVLYLTYQTVAMEIRGSYVVCVLFDNHVLINTSTTKPVKLYPLAIISLGNLQVEAVTGDQGLQALSSLHTWKVVFTADDNNHEILLSACSQMEEDQWISGLQGQFRPQHFLHIATLFDQSRTFKDLNIVSVMNQPCASEFPITPRQCTDIQKRQTVFRVILRNTYNPQDLQEFRNAATFFDHEPPSKVEPGKTIILAPKRNERTRLETALSDIYTKERLPFPGMIGSKGGQMIRASAGSLVRKLSFASMQASFSRRSASLSSKKSHHTIHTFQRHPTTFSVRKQSLGDHNPNRHGRPKELPELDTMDRVIERMIGSEPSRKRLSFSNGEKLLRKNTKNSRRHEAPLSHVGPDDPAATFYTNSNITEMVDKELETKMHSDSTDKDEIVSVVKRKRWSNPISKLRGLGTDGIKHILHSSS